MHHEKKVLVVNILSIIVGFQGLDIWEILYKIFLMTFFPQTQITEFKFPETLLAAPMLF